MEHHIHSIRPFIGAKDFEESRKFYSAWGFKETTLDIEMSVFHYGNFSFYLQNAYVKDWVDNTMIFMEVKNVETYWQQLQELDLPKKFKTVRLSPIKYLDWGKECFVHDPSGILWHIGEFK